MAVTVTAVMVAGSLASVSGQFVASLALNQAVVDEGDSEMCQLFSISSAMRFSQARPVLGPLGMRAVYMEVYSCGADATSRIPYQDKLEDGGFRPSACGEQVYQSVASICRELLFIWSRAMGEEFKESLPAALSGLQAVEGAVMLRVTYRGVGDAGKDTTGFELTEVPRGEEGGRLVLGHRIPRLILLPGIKSWRSMAVCTSDCLDNLEDDWGLSLHQVSVYTGSRGRSARLSRVAEGGAVSQLALVPLEGGWGEAGLGPVQLLPSDSLVMECVFDTTGDEMPVVGGVGEQLEHCMAVLTFTGVSSVLECRSQPTDVSVTWALDLTLQGRGEEYAVYDNEVEEIFNSVLDSSDSSDYSDVFSRRRRQTSNGEKVIDPFLDTVFTDQGFSVRDALQQMRPNASTSYTEAAQEINMKLVRDAEHAVFCDLREEMLRPLKTASLEESAPQVLAATGPGAGAGGHGPLLAMVATLGAVLLIF